jgi:hypothetical protein
MDADRARVTTQGISAALSVSASGNFSLAGAGSGASVDSNLSNLIEASVIGSDIDAATLSVTAEDRVDLDTLTVAAAASVSASGTAAVSLAGAVAVTDVAFDTSVRAVVSASDVDLASALPTTISARSDADVVTLSVGAAISIAASGTVAPSVAVGVSTATVTTSNLTEALLSGGSSFTGPGDLTLLARDVTNIDTDAVAASVAVGASGAVAISVSVAASIADNTYDGTVRSGILGSSVDVGGALTVDAESEATIDVFGVAAAVSVAAAGTFSLAAGLTAAVTSNTVDGLIEALIEDSGGTHSVVADDAILVRAVDDLTVTSDAAAVTLSVSGSYVGGSVAVSAATSENTRTTVTRAEIDNSIVTSDTSTVTVRGRSESTLDATVASVAVSVSISIGFAGAGAGGFARNTSTSVLEARVDNGSTVTSAGNVVVEAHDVSDATAEVYSFAISGALVGASVGV